MSKETTKIASTNPSSRECVAGVENLIIDILLRLPAKSLIRFELVSKQWLSLICDQKFAQSHVQKNPRTLTSGMFLDHAISPEIDFFWLENGDVKEDTTGACGRAGLSFDFLSNVFHGIGNKAKILHSCNGLFLCCDTYNHYSNLYVCNPITKKYRFIPLPDKDIPFDAWSVSGVGFAFDPSISPHYKLVCESHFRHRNSPMLSRVEVYSSEDHQWRRLLEFNESPVNKFRHRQGVFIDGGIHWLGHHSFHFDLNSESLVQRSRPPCPRLVSDSIETTALRFMDKYSYLIIPSRKKLYVFDLSNDYNNWVIKYCVSVFHKRSAFPENRRDKVSALCVIEGPSEEDTVLLLAVPEKIVSYKLMRKYVRTVCKFPAEPAHRFAIRRTFPLIETLSPV